MSTMRPVGNKTDQREDMRKRGYRACCTTQGGRLVKSEWNTGFYTIRLGPGASTAYGGRAYPDPIVAEAPATDNPAKVECRQ